MSFSLKLRSRPVYAARAAVLYSIFALIVEGICFLAEAVSENLSFSIYIYSVVFPCLIGLIWVIFLISLLFSKIIWIDNNEIKAIRFNKVIWNIKKDDIEICLYYGFKWWHLFIPISAFASGDLTFKLKSGIVSKYSCCLSRKQIEKICNTYDYQIECDKK